MVVLVVLMGVTGNFRLIAALNGRCASAQMSRVVIYFYPHGELLIGTSIAKARKTRGAR